MNLSTVIVTLNEQDWIGNCLKSVADISTEIIVVDSFSNDKTQEICKQYGAKVFVRKWAGFSDQKNFALTKVSGDWVLFLDADERATSGFKKDLMKLDNHFSAYRLPRKNILLGKQMKYGGWAPDFLTRLAQKDKIKSWKGDLHEELMVDGDVGTLNEGLYHLSHRGITWMLEKSIKYTDTEAQLRFDAGHPQIVWWRFFRVMATEFFSRLILNSGWRDGTVGWIESISQAYNVFLVYARLWEKQQGKPMADIYHDIDEELAAKGY